MTGDVRVGVDVLLRDRIGRIARHPRYRRLVFTPAELRQSPAGSPARVEEYLAGRFAAKEAVAKLLGRGFLCGLVWRDIEVLRDDAGAPRVALHAGARDAAHGQRLGGIRVSISHQGPIVVSVAVGVTES